MQGVRILDQGTKDTVESANLRYVTDDSLNQTPAVRQGLPLHRRELEVVKGAEVLNRIRALAIPPA
jgi:hypothetical protein